MLLSLVDANGRTGGTFPIIVEVICTPVFTTFKLSYSRILKDGTQKNCATDLEELEGSVKKSLTPPLTITTDVIDVLQTCQPWGITAKGGVPPYTLTIASLGATTLNVTFPLGHDVFTYINRAYPGTQLIGP